MDLFGRKRARYFHALANKVEAYKALPFDQSQDFVRTGLHFDLRWQSVKMFKEEISDELLEDALISECDGVMDLALELGIDDAVGACHAGSKLHVQVIAGTIAKIAAHLIKPRSQAFSSDREFKKFVEMFEEFVKCPVKQASGQEVALMQFMVDPAGNIPMSPEARKALSLDDD